MAPSGCDSTCRALQRGQRKHGTQKITTEHLQKGSGHRKQLLHPGDLEMRFNLFRTNFSAWKSRTKRFGVFLKEYRVTYILGSARKKELGDLGVVWSLLWWVNPSPSPALPAAAVSKGLWPSPVTSQMCLCCTFGPPSQAWSPWKHQKMGQGQRAPQLVSVHVHPTPAQPP